ncbi:hypothetical protein C0J52_10409 [Blattella germanica]|nr:hypothetical protein C0J52_10409 [Blattella germanica]
MALCLICMTSLTIMTKFNMKRHYYNKHKQAYASITEKERISKMESLKAKFITKELNLDPTTFLSEEYGRENISEEILTKTTSQVFNPEWQNLFFVQFDGMPKCLICCKTLTLSTKFNLQRHYFKMHHDQYGMLSDEQRIGEIKNLTEKFFKLYQRTTLTSQNGSQECNVKPNVDPMSFVEIKTETVNIKEETQDCETKGFESTCSPIDINMKEEVHCGPDYVKSEMQMIIDLQDNKIQDLSAVESNNKISDIQPNADIRPCYPCNICSMKFFCKKSYIKHQRFHKENEKYKCESCNVTYLNEDELASHMEFHVESLHVCEICHKKFPLKWSLLRHMLRHSKQTKKSFEHENCNQEFENASKLKTHSVSHTVLRTHVCDICNKQFSDRSSLNKHRMIHMDDRPYSCNLCNRSFVQKNDFLIHKQRHTGIRLFLCEFCGKTFYTQRELMKHLLVHGGQRPFICDICKKSFYTKSSLIDHMNIHMGKRPYVCEVCNKSFNRKDNLRIHKMLHQQIRPHVCVFCNKGFAQQQNLRKHLLIH